MRIRAVAAALALLGLSVACSSTPPTTTTPPSVSSTGAVVGTSFGTQALAANAAYAAQMKVLEVASRGFTLDLTTTLPPLEASGPQADALALAVRAQAKWLVSTGLTSSVTTTGSTAKSVGLRGDSRTGKVESAIIGIDDALIIAGIAIVAWGASKGVHKAVDLRTGPAKEKIEQASPEDLKVISESLGVGATTTKEEAVKAFDELGMSARLIKAKQIEQDLRLAEVNGKKVEPIAAEKIQRAVAESSVECGKTALKATVSASTFTGQGYGQAAQALGASVKTAAVVDFTISAVAEGTNTPLQPLDRFADHLDATFASKATESVTVPPAPSGVSAADAKSVLSGSDPKLADFAKAIDVQVHAVIDPLASLLSAVVGSFGMKVAVPQQLHQVSVEMAKNVQPIQVRNIGPAISVVATDCHGAQLQAVDTSVPGKISYTVGLGACGKGDCAAVLQLVDLEVTLPVLCEQCIHMQCGSLCEACNPTCIRKSEGCYERCETTETACLLGCACSGEGCASSCKTACYSALSTCTKVCNATPEAEGTGAIGECIQTLCAEPCASVIH